MICFLDTDVCIAHLRAADRSLESYLGGNPELEVRLPAVVAAELIYGARKSVSQRNLEWTKGFISQFMIEPFSDSAIGHYADIRLFLEKQGVPIGPNDLLIAAIVRANGGLLLTNNVGEFRRIPQMQVVSLS